MRLRYHELVGKQVFDAHGQRVGRVEDLRAEARGESLRVTALLVGPASFIRRVGVTWARLFQALPPGEVPWSAVERVTDRVHLRVSRDTLHLPHR